ncbi:hypothetical protein NDN08_003833 [Rhodosorus marinus]|uniref:Protein ZIP4 homolog n=1 Tax=Rhodosorus marinus TaxID=101924 RepID=A0AAV8UGK1_9RHOD|nr:hypothetical protein NDN08_003833 [Rhodosorus marinus]
MEASIPGEGKSSRVGVRGERRGLDRSNLSAPEGIGRFKSFRPAKFEDSDESEKEKEREKGDGRSHERKRKKGEKHRKREKKRSRTDRIRSLNARVERPALEQIEVDESLFETRQKTATAIIPKPADFSRQIAVRCFFIDNNADPNNMAFGSPYTKDVPYYRRRVNRIHRSSNDIGTFSQTTARFFSRASRRLPPAHYIRKSDTEKEKDGQNFISFRQGERSSDEVDSEEEFISSTRNRVRELNTATRENPSDASAWLALVAFQDTLSNAGLQEASVVTERKISILAKALAEIPRAEQSRVSLVLRYLEIVSERWTASDADYAFEKAVKDNPGVGVIWIERLRHALSSLSFFSVERVADLCTAGVEALAPYPETEEDRLELIMAHARVLFASGKAERAIGLLQALLEYGLFSPEVQGPALSHEAQKILFSAFWRSGAPRIGEQGGKGWGSWAVETRLRLSGYGREQPTSDQLSTGKPPPPPPPPPPGTSTAPPPPSPGIRQSSIPPPPPPPVSRLWTTLPIKPPSDGTAADTSNINEEDANGDLGAEEDSAGTGSSVADNSQSGSENEWSASSDEEYQDVQEAVEAAYEKEDVDACDLVRKWIGDENHAQEDQWLPVRNPASIGLGSGREMLIAEALRVAERLVGMEDIILASAASGKAPWDRFLRRLIAELIQMVCAVRLWDFGESGTGYEPLPELSGWTADSSVLVATSLLDTFDSPESFLRRLYGLIKHGVDFERFKEVESNRADFALAILREVSALRPNLCGPETVMLTSVREGHDAAKKCARKLLKRNPDQYSLYNTLAGTLEREGKLEQAVNIYMQLKNMSTKPEPVSVATCNLIRIYSCRFFNHKDAAGKIVTSISGAESGPASRTDVLKFRRELRERLDSCRDGERLDALLSVVSFELLAVGAESVASVAAELLENHPGLRQEISWVTAYVLLFAHLQKSGRGATTALKRTLVSGLMENPGDQLLLGINAALAVSFRQSDSRRLLYKLTTVAPDNARPYVVAAFTLRSLNERNRAHAMLSRCVARTGSKSPWAWRLLLELSPEGDRRREFLRGATHCSWCKAFWVDALDSLGNSMSRAEAADITAIMEEKGIYFRVPLRESLLKSTDTT